MGEPFKLAHMETIVAKVQAHNVMGSSAASKEGGTAVIPDLPGPPTNLQRVETQFVSDDEVQVRFTWNPPENLEDAILIDY